MSTPLPPVNANPPQPVPTVSADGAPPLPTVAPTTTSPPAAAPLARPTVRFMLAHPAHVLALGLGSGLSRWAPGTAGTLWAWLSFWAFSSWFSDVQMATWLAASLAVGWWACKVTADHMQVADPGSIVWDEIVAFWLVLWLVSPTDLWGQCAAFVLFRYFDAAKPGPVAWADATFKGTGWRGSWGILFDDLVAAFCTVLVIAIWRAWQAA